MSRVPFDPTDVRAVNNPPFLLTEPLKIDAWQFIGKTIYVDPRRVRLMEGQPRSDAEEAEIQEMAEAIRSVGQQETGSAFPIHDPDYDVELIGGHRRTLSCRRAGCMVRIEIRPVPTDRRQQYIAAVAGNCNRKDLSLRDTVHAIAELLSYKCSYEQIATIFGKTVSWVKQYALLTTLHSSVFPLLEGRADAQLDAKGRKLRRVTMLTVGYAAEVARLPQEEQFTAAEAIIEEGMRIEGVKHFIGQRLKRNGTYRTNKHSPGELMRLLEEEIWSFDRFLRSYQELSTSDVIAMRAQKTQNQRSSMANRLFHVSQELTRLARLVGPIQASLLGCHPAIQGWVERQVALWQSSGLSLESWMNDQHMFSERMSNH